MATENLVPVIQFCTIHEVELSFVNSLQEYGLIEIVTVEETNFIQQEQIGHLEKIMRLHYDLDINLEGIEAIVHMLQRMENMKEEMRVLKNRLRIYED